MGIRVPDPPYTWDSMFERFPPLRVLIAAAGLAGALLMAATPAFADNRVIFPPPVSPNGSDLYNLYQIIAIPAIVIFVGVEIALLIIIVRFRRRRLGASYVPPQWHGNNTIEVVWTVIPLLIVAFIAVVSFLVLQKDFVAGNADFQADMNVKVVGGQFEWDYTYPNGYTLKEVGSATGQVDPFVVPTGKVVRLQLQGRDVIHSWWVPEITGKTDAVPGYDNYTWFKIDQPGLFRGECAELCGAGHYTMQILVKAVSQSDFDAWMAQQLAQQNQPTPSPSPSASPSPSPSPSAQASASPSAGASPQPTPSATP